MSIFQISTMNVVAWLLAVAFICAGIGPLLALYVNSIRRKIQSLLEQQPTSER